MKKGSVVIRANKKTLTDLREALPNMSDAKRIDVLYNTSAIKIDNILRKNNFKDDLGSLLYGSKTWKKIKKR